jgi:hypothetical protein
MKCEIAMKMIFQTDTYKTYDIIASRINGTVTVGGLAGPYEWEIVGTVEEWSNLAHMVLDIIGNETA